MEATVDLYSTIFLLGAAHGLFLALALINTKGGNPTSHRLLALLTLLFSIDLGLEFLEQSHHITAYLRLVIIDINIDFLFGPLTYLYVCSLTTREGFRFGAKQWLHFLPFAVGFLLLFPLFKLDSNQLLNLFFQEGGDPRQELLWAEAATISVGLLSFIQMAIYLVVSIRRLFRHQRLIQDHFSSLERISLTWLRNLLIALAVLYLLYIADLFLADLFAFSEQLISYHYLMIVVVIYSMGYLGLRQPSIFSYRPNEAPDKTEPVEPTSHETIENPDTVQTKKYQRSALDNETSILLYKALQAHMDREKSHLDSKLTLAQLAEQLAISSNYLSQVINEQAGQNFFDFINSYRINEAKQSLINPSQGDTNILSIALNAGFNSKSAFYTAFKRQTGQTPSQFRKSSSSQSSIS
ncbi:MAG: AraC family transcriptional regulator [Candidatus Thiodiazotropha sp. (ex Lucinoma borealis)]|nr:AraC family transcriptional regulator [Candidatus Thiodiazotropha sp. (ex Lucinoma borealis)]